MSKRSKAIRCATSILLASALLLVACAPAAGRATVEYQAQAQDVISAVAEIGITLQPGSAFNFFSINSIGERFITLQATTTGGFSFFFGGTSVTLNFSAIQNGEYVTLAAGGTGGSASNDAIDQIIAQLDLRFTRVR
jgi:hypothetical protein